MVAPIIAAAPPFLAAAAPVIARAAVSGAVAYGTTKAIEGVMGSSEPEPEGP